MNKKPVDKPLTEGKLREILPGLLEKSFKKSFKPAFQESFKPAFQESFKPAFQESFKPAFKEAFKPAFKEAFEPYALAIQQDFNAVRSDIADLHDGQQRIEQRQIAESKRKDILSIKIDAHEGRIVRLEKSSTR